MHCHYKISYESIIAELEVNYHVNEETIFL